MTEQNNQKDVIEGEVVESSKAVLNPTQVNQIIKTVDPEKEIEFATKSSKALTNVIKQSPGSVVEIQGHNYLKFEAWQTIARFYGASVGTESTKPIMVNDKIIGYDAKAVVYFGGQVIGSAEASCMNDEKNWIGKPMFQLKSMAQTRACSKALRNVFAWVVVLEGYKATPAEEMDGVKKDQNFNNAPSTPTPPTNNNQNNNNQNSHRASDKQVKYIFVLAKEKLNATTKEAIAPLIEKVMGIKNLDFKTLMSGKASLIIEFLNAYNPTNNPVEPDTSGPTDQDVKNVDWPDLKNKPEDKDEINVEDIPF